MSYFCDFKIQTLARLVKKNQWKHLIYQSIILPSNRVKRPYMEPAWLPFVYYESHLSNLIFQAVKCDGSPMMDQSTD